MAYSDKPNIQILLALLKEHRVKQVVLCPGSRNAPIVHSIAQDSYFTSTPVTDERSAGFYAIGIAQSLRQPVAVVCSSGSALLNIHSAVSEAYYRNIPLVVISADRPPEWIGQMDGQTLPQPGLFGSLVRHSVHLPEGKDEADKHFCNRLVNEALLEATQNGGGPVHINVPLSEPLFSFETESLPEERMIRRNIRLTSRMASLWRQHNKRLILAGQQEYKSAPILPPDNDTWVMVSESIANRPESGIENVDTMLATLPEKALENLRPSLVVTMEGHMVSKRLKRWLRANPPAEHWHISPRGEVVDLLGCLTRVVVMESDHFLQQVLKLNSPLDKQFSYFWHHYSHRIGRPQFAYSSMALIGLALEQLKPHLDYRLHLANSAAVRHAQYFPIPNRVTVHSNRGVNGIDGSLSTAVAAAISLPEEQHLLVIGDLSFFYDMTILGGRELPGNLKILLINNGGGGIFYGLKGMPVHSPTASYIMGHHNQNAKGWCEVCGVRYIGYEGKSTEKVTPLVEQLMDPSSKVCTLLEARTSAENDVEIQRKYFSELRKQFNNQL